MSAAWFRYLHLDVFTDRLFGGNQLAVFPEAGGLDGATMQATGLATMEASRGRQSRLH